MKRSEMIQDLEEAFWSFPDPRAIAQKALRIVEKAGMTPPYYHRKMMYNDNGEKSTVYLNEWEPENENKSNDNSSGATRKRKVHIR